MTTLSLAGICRVRELSKYRRYMTIIQILQQGAGCATKFALQRIPANNDLTLVPDIVVQEMLERCKRGIADLQHFIKDFGDDTPALYLRTLIEDDLNKVDSGLPVQVILTSQSMTRVTRLLSLQAVLQRVSLNDVLPKIGYAWSAPIVATRTYPEMVRESLKATLNCYSSLIEEIEKATAEH